MSSLAKSTRETLKTVGEIVDHGTGKALQIVGLGVFVVSILFRFAASLSIFDVRLEFHGTDYLVTLAASLLLVAWGAGVRLYEFRTGLAWDQKALELAASSEERAEAAAADARKKTQEALGGRGASPPTV